MPYAGESTELISQLRSELAQRDDQIKSLHAVVELREKQLTQCKAELVTQLNKAIKEIEDYNDVYKNRCFELSNVLQELAKAKKDGERLDWLETRRLEFDVENPGFAIYATMWNGAARHRIQYTEVHKTLRQAIDAAMQSETSGNQPQQG